MAMQILLLLCLFQYTIAHLTITPRAFPHVNTEGNLPRLWKRQDQCDVAQFFCPTGTCFTDPANGYIGCCSISSCAPRTSCIEYDPSITRPCDPNTGGCLYCSDSANPHCLTITNVLAGQWIQYCATTASTETISYYNPITGGSQWTDSTSATFGTSVDVPVATSRAYTPSSTDQSAASTQQSTTIVQTSTIMHQSSIATATISHTAFSTQLTEAAVTTSTTSANLTISQSSQATGNAILSAGAIGGVVAGAVFGVSAVLAGVWMLRKRSTKQHNTIRRVSEKQSETEPPHGTEDDPAEAEGSVPQGSKHYYSPDGIAQHQEADSRPISMLRSPELHSTTGLGIKNENRSSRYFVSNPDEGHSSSPVVSPLLSQGSTPKLAQSPILQAPPESSQYSGGKLATTQAAVSATTQSLVDGPARSPAKTPTTSRYYACTPYTPSMYAVDPPGSIANTTSQLPPSLPQPYSTATIIEAPSSIAQRQGLYRGLSGRLDESSPPWAYLSPESAINGGWVNGA